MLAFLTEFIGSFVFIASVLISNAYYPVEFRPIIIALTLLAMIYFGNYISGGHYNPVISTMMFIKGELNIGNYIGFIVSQIFGGLIALLWFQHAMKIKK